MHLIYNKNFWTFYKLNRQQINGIIARLYKKYRIPCEFDEFLNQLLIKLHEKDFLKEFDEKKSHLKTYIINRLRWHALHVINDYERKTRLQLVNVDNKYLEDTPDFCDFEEGVISHISRNEFRETLSKENQKILSLVELKYNRKEMSEILKISVRLLSSRLEKLMAKAEKFYSERRKIHVSI